MNKKFYTLVAALLMASSGAGLHAQITAPIDVNVSNSAVTLTTAGTYSESTKTGGYEVGKSYFLSGNGTSVLLVDDSDNKTLKYAAPTLTSLSSINYATWTLQQIVAPAGAVAPKYVFVNNGSKAVLSMDASKAVSLDNKAAGVTSLAEGQSEWLSAPSYKAPNQNNALYAALEGDAIIALAETGVNNTVTLVKTTKDKLSGSDLLKIQPYVVAANSVLTLSPRDLNTMLGAAGNTATADSYFSLSFDPEATVNGGANLFSTDLQATAVTQFEIAYGKDPQSANFSTDVVTPSGSKYLYASLYPVVKSDAASTYKAHIDANNSVAYNESGAQWVALRNRDGKYLVVDTAFVGGTTQAQNGRITFTFDNLYNAKNETRFRDPRSYLFRFDYNPSTGNVDIISLAYAEKKTAPYASPFKEADYYGATAAADAYKDQAKQYGSEWYVVSTNEQANTGTSGKNYIVKAALGATTEVTLGAFSTTEPFNKFTIKLGHSEIYTPAYIASGAYLLKVTGSKVQDRIGKYYVNNLTGGFEVMEQAVRQNFQHMPAAQWVVKATGTTAGSPVEIVNREFTAKPSSYYNGKAGIAQGGTPYGVAGAGTQAFFMGTDTLEFIPVTAADDAKLGYKYVAKDTINLSNFTFNYLHQLGMDKPINTVNDKDSVVWVDANGNAIRFILEKAIEDDTYGTNLGLANVAALTRDAYYIKVNDASKVQNDKRYLCYDEAKKKYVVSAKDKDKADKFFLKENNEVAGGSCYYTMVTPSQVNVIAIPATVNLNVGQTIENKEAVAANGGDGKTYITVGENGKATVYDNDVRNLFIATNGKVYNKETGRWSDGKVVKVFTYTAANKYEYENYANNTYYYDVIVLSSSYEIKDATSITDNDLYIVRYKSTANFASGYASSKVSVDNNTLDLVNGVLSNSQGNEVANSAFAVVRDADPLYRRFNTTLEAEVASDAPKALNFYRVNGAEKEYLYEDATSKYSKDLNFNFLGVEDKGVVGKNPSIFVDTAYVERADIDVMPQYLLALRPNVVVGDTTLCDAQNHAHETEEEALACPHTSITPSYTSGWYLVNLQDSVNVNEGKAKQKYQWNNNYTRLGFVEATHKGDTLIIKNSIYTGNDKQINKVEATTWASKDSIFLGDNKHNNVKFSFRLLKSGSNDFLIESEGNQVAPEKGGWIKIQNGVPVIAKYDSYKEAALDAEVFNVEPATQAPTANESIDATEVSIVAVNGGVQVLNAAGKTVKVYTILGQQLASQIVTSDNATIAVPAGIVAVSVDGAEAVKVVVK